MDNTKAILFVVTSFGRIDERHPTGLWFEEFAIPFERFTEEGYLVTVASIKGGMAPIDPRSLPENQESLTVKGPLEALKHTQRLMDVDITEYDAAFFPGGHGAMFDFPQSHEIAELVTRYLKQGKVVAAICHAGWMLASANIVRGKTATSYRSIKDDMVNAGANWVDREVVRDGTLITSRSPADLPAFMRTTIAALRERRHAPLPERQVALAG